MALLKVMWSDVVLTKTVAVYAYWLISKSQTASDVQDAENFAQFLFHVRSYASLHALV